MSPATRSSSAPTGPALHRLPLLALGFIALIAGTLAGLARLGWVVPDLATSAAALHGPLMVCGFFGVVIALERAVAIGRGWAYLGPLAAGLGGLLVLAGISWAAWLFVAGALVLLTATLDVFRRQQALFTFTLVLGAASFVVGCTLWASGGAVHEVVLYWLAFLVLTIAGERLELSRFRPPSAMAVRVFAAILIAVVLALAAMRMVDWSVRLFAAALLALAIWLAKQDIAVRTVRSQGLTRFIAVCLLSGYFWLGAGSAVLLAAGALTPGAAGYDAALHALLVGFVFSMVFGHAPIIFPAVLRVAVPYHPSFYAPLVLLHGSIVVRLAGDALGAHELLRIGGLANALALAAFIVGTASAVMRGRLAATR